MTADQYKHTWTLPADSRMLRMYGWMWKAEPEGTTFCKLFWGYIFAPVNLVARLFWALLWPLRAVLRPVGRWMKEEAAKAESEEKRKKRQPKPPKDEIPGRIADFFARPLTRRIAKIVGICLLIPLALVGLAAFVIAGYYVYLGVPLLVTWFLHTDAWVVVVTVLASIAAWLLIVGALMGLNTLFDLDTRWKQRKKRRAEAGKLTFGQLLYHGAVAVKANTCPRIEVKDDAR